MLEEWIARVEILDEDRVARGHIRDAKKTSPDLRDPVPASRRDDEYQRTGHRDAELPRGPRRLACSEEVASPSAHSYPVTIRARFDGVDKFGTVELCVREPRSLTARSVDTPATAVPSQRHLAPGSPPPLHLA